MNYSGKLYGKVGGEYFPLNHTSDQFDKMLEALKLSKKIIHSAMGRGLVLPSEEYSQIESIIEELN